jgi:hypothetical protein
VHINNAAAILLLLEPFDIVSTRNFFQLKQLSNHPPTPYQQVSQSQPFATGFEANFSVNMQQEVSEAV